MYETHFMRMTIYSHILESISKAHGKRSVSEEQRSAEVLDYDFVQFFLPDLAFVLPFRLSEAFTFSNAPVELITPVTGVLQQLSNAKQRLRPPTRLSAQAAQFVSGTQTRCRHHRNVELFPNSQVSHDPEN